MVIVMLGTNDLKHHLGASASETARGIERLIEVIEAYSAAVLRDKPQILIVSPPGIRFGALASDSLFQGAAEKLCEYPRLFSAVAAARGCHFLDAAQCVNPSVVDGVHLDEQGHLRLARMIARTLIPLSR